MAEQNKIVTEGNGAGEVISDRGEILTIPENWQLLPPGDAGLTRLVKSKGVTWSVQVKRGRRLMSKGIWADARQIGEAKEELAKKRSSPQYLQKRKKDKERNERKHQEFVVDFHNQILLFLDFHPKYSDVAENLARLVTETAAPVGSGTVARSRQVTLEKKAERAVIAWLRHQTTYYDSMKIAPVKGRRRKIRYQLAQQSQQLLENYRRGEDISPLCPLLKVVRQYPAQDVTRLGSPDQL